MSRAKVLAEDPGARCVKQRNGYYRILGVCGSAYTGDFAHPRDAQSAHDRVQWAEYLIDELPGDHEGRNSWLLNYGTGKEAQALRKIKGITWNRATRSATKTGVKWT